MNLLVGLNRKLIEKQHKTMKKIDSLVNLTKDIVERIKEEISDREIFKKRNEISQKLLELTYHVYGR
jgi:anti-sigma28 factor (negative regulator of flagellin synthesis)